MDLSGISMSVINFLNEIGGTTPLHFEAIMLEDSGQFREALQLYRSIAIENKTNFGELHLKTVNINFRVALMLYRLKENVEAFTAFDDVYSKVKVISEPEDELALTARGYMANILRRTGKVALPIYQKIHEILSRKSPHKMITLSIKINIALELSDQGKFSESVDILDEVIRILGQINSNKDEIWNAMVLKADVLLKQGKSSEATSIIRYLHEEYKAAYGEDNPKTWSNLECLGLFLADQGEYDQAEGILKAVLNGSKMENSEGNTIINKFVLALVLKKQGKLDDSLALLKDLHRNLRNNSLQSIFGLFTKKLLAKIHDQQGKYEEALILYKEILIAEKPDSPDLDITLNIISRINGQLGKSNKTGPSPNELYEIESLKLWEIFLPEEKSVEDYP